MDERRAIMTLLARSAFKAPQPAQRCWTLAHSRSRVHRHRR
jgi:hypothetical protein